MAHKAMIDGKAYEIGGGKIMVGGKVYSVAKGKTMVGGKAYEVAFGPSVINIKITTAGNSNYCYALINGAKYSESGRTATIQPGSSIDLQIRNTSNKKTIIIDGVTVASKSSQANFLSYKYTPTAENVSIAFRYSTTSESRITVTTS